MILVSRHLMRISHMRVATMTMRGRSPLWKSPLFLSLRRNSGSATNDSIQAVIDPSTDSARSLLTPMQDSPDTFSTFVLEPIQSTLVDLHDSSGLPWWLTLCIAALGVRSCLLPVVYFQMHEMSRVAAAAPQLSYLYELFQRSLRVLPVGDSAGRIDKTRVFLRGAQAALRLNKARPLLAFASPLCQIPVFVTFILATRGLVDIGGHGLEVGGIGVFLDLTARDSSLFLPCLAVSLTYLNLELSMGLQPRAISPISTNASSTNHSSEAHEKSSELKAWDVTDSPNPGPTSTGIIVWVKQGLQTALICSLPMVATLPSGAFVFWITSSTFSCAQTLLLQREGARRALGLRP